jgi:hypothetical protein
VPLAPVARRRLPPGAWPAAAGLAWVALVAAMAEAGYSGEPRYALPGAALLVVSGGAGLAALARGRRAAGAVALVAVAAFAAVRVDGVGTELRDARDEAALYGTLDDAVRAAGGREPLLACGRPVVGRLRGPALAYALHVHKQRVAFDRVLGGPVFRSRIRPGATVQPDVAAGLPVLGRSARWEVRGTCGIRVRQS